MSRKDRLAWLDHNRVTGPWAPPEYAVDIDIEGTDKLIPTRKPSRQVKAHHGFDRPGA